jgi:hypothetical protein
VSIHISCVSGNGILRHAVFWSSKEVNFLDSVQRFFECLDMLCPENWLWLMTLDHISLCTALKHSRAFNSEYIHCEYGCCQIFFL